MANKTITPIIYDNSGNMRLIVDNYKSLIWTTRYYDHGDFEIVVPLNKITATCCQATYYIMRDDDENIGIIEKVEAKISETDEEILIVSGRFATQILARRIIAEQTEVNGTVAEAINQLITDAIISPTIPERQISNFVLGDYSTEETITAQYTGKNLYTVIHDICTQYGLGFKITLNENKQFVFSLYKGVDRSYNQSENPYVVFSNVYDNLINIEFQVDFRNVITTVLSAGEGEGLQRKTVWVSNPNISVLPAVGLYRYEYYLDARNTSSNEGEISEQDYLDQLAELGKENFTPYEMTTAGEVLFTSIEFKKDVNIGDLVVVEDSRLAQAFTVRIIEVIESISESGAYTIIPTFGQ